MSTVDVYVPVSLRSYTGEKKVVQADGATLGDVLNDLERNYPGIRFRIMDEQDHVRSHIQLFVNQARPPGLELPMAPGDQVKIILAISGG